MEPSPIRSPSKEGQPPRMVCVIFVAGHNDLLESEIASDVSGRFDKLKGVPKALLPAAASADGSGSTILGRWWNLVNTRQILEVFLVTNANKFKYYERWATANDFPVENIINDGTTSAASRMGSVADLDLVLRSKPSIAESDVMVVAGDMIFSNDFDISGVQRFFREKQGDVAVYYELPPQEQSSSRGIIEVDPRTSLVTSFYEKPAEGVTTSRFASVVFYMFRRTSLPLLATYLAAHPAIEQRVFGSFLAWLVAPPAAPASTHNLFGMKLATAFELIGQSGLHEYLACVEGLQQSQRGGGASLGSSAASPITRRAHARVGLVGNPSDGFHGKTISVSIENFWAEVSIHESDTVRLVPHAPSPICAYTRVHMPYIYTCHAQVRLVPNVLSDPNDFGSLADLHGISRKVYICKYAYRSSRARRSPEPEP